jgi:hypothetical protein
MGRSNHTDSYYRIFKKQHAWAKKKRLSLDALSHVSTLEANLFAPLHPTTRAEYEAADGKELKSKLFSVMSSAALVCNVFDYWRSKGRAATIAKCCAIPDSVTQLSFEPAFEIFEGKKPARPDAALIDGPSLRDAQVLTAVEAKFAEPYRRSNFPDREPFSETYFKPASSSIWLGLTETKKLAETIRLRWKSTPLCPLFEYLDVPQLIKDAIGLNLASRKGKRFTLLYLWFEVRIGAVPTADSAQLRNEIDLFRKATAGEFTFRDLTYQSLFGKIQDVGQEHLAYTRYLADRYFD